MPIIRRGFVRFTRRRPPAGRRRKGSFFSLPIAVIIILAAGIASLSISSKVKPILQMMAVNRANNIAIMAINDAINDEVTNGNIDYSKIIIMEKDSDGKITALKTNMLEINRIKADITNNVVYNVSGIESTELSIPIGNLLESEFFSGRGPKIPFKIIPLGTANASFNNVFSEAGINQTRHQIVMSVTVDIGVMLPGFTTGAQVSTQVNIAETIIVGGVPHNYVHFNGALSDFLPKAADQEIALN